MANQKCIHCGADCGKHPIIWQDKPFCCNGCKQVYMLLSEAKLQQYYNIEQMPGVKVESDSYQNKYAYLDKEEVQSKIFDFYENNIAKTTFYIPEIHCASCIWLLEHLSRLNKGIKHSAVNFIKKELTVSFNTQEISLRQLVELLVSIHYVPDLSLQTLEKKNPAKANKKLLYKVGVAGFVFGNVMLYSLPEYFNGEPIGGSLGVFFYYLCYVLTVPLVFYSGLDYIVSGFKNLFKGIINIDLPIAIGILTLFFVTSYEVLSGQGPGYSDSLSGFLFFLLIGRWYQNKTYQSLSFDRDYKSYFPVAVTKIANQKEESTLLKDIEIGDKLLIRSKELIPADSILVSGQALIDYSFVTGESTPVQKNEGEFIYAGGIQTSGSITIEVNKEVKQSHLTQLWNQNKNEEKKSKSLVSIIDVISVYFTIAVIAIALLGFAYWFNRESFGQAILILTSILIVACPCALALSLPFTFGTTMRVFGARGLYIKNTGVIEKLTKINTIVFDKTGTITQPDKNNITFMGEKLSDLEKQAIISVAGQSTHPLSNAIYRNSDNISTLTVEGFVEVMGRGVFGKVDSMNIKLGSQEYVQGEAVVNTQNTSTVYVAINDDYKGCFTIKNKYRQGFKGVIEKLSLSYALFLLSGDNDAEKETLSNYFIPEHLHFNQSPVQKKEYITKLQQEGKQVLMTGDGLNDAGAFMQSDVALSIADDIYHFSPAGDAIIEASKFEHLNKFISFSKKSLTVVKMSFVISLMYNIIGLGFAITGNLSPVVAAILMPISSITVVSFATFATQLMARRYLPKVN